MPREYKLCWPTLKPKLKKKITWQLGKMHRSGKMYSSLLSIRNLQSMASLDIEIIEAFHGGSGCWLTLKVYKGNARSGVHHSNVQQTRVLAEQHVEHVYLCVVRQILHKERFVSYSRCILQQQPVITSHQAQDRFSLHNHPSTTLLYVLAAHTQRSTWQIQVLCSSISAIAG